MSSDRLPIDSSVPLPMSDADGNQNLLAVPAASDFADEPARLIPVIEERIEVRKEVVETGQIRLVKTVEARDEVVSTPLTHEELTVERVAVNRYVDAAPPSRQEGNTTIYPVMQEVVVVEKRLLLVEEVRVTRQVIDTVDEQTVTLRRETVTVERDGPTNERSA